MQKAYEMLVILNYEITDEEIESKIEKIRDILSKEKGEIKGINKWGKRRLAFEIKKTKKGFYLLLQLMLEPDSITNIEHDLKYVEGINRFMIARISEKGAAPFPDTELDMTEEAI